MEYLFIVIYAASFVFFTLFERVKKFIYLIVLQGIVLFALAFINLFHIDTIELVFILLETIIVKSVVVPVFLRKMTMHNHLKRVHEVHIPVFYSILLTGLIILASFILSSYLDFKTLNTKVFSIAISSLIFGMYFIANHKNIFSHLIGYLIIENGIFLFSIAVGSKMPILIGLAILLDILIGVLIIGVFVNKVQDRFHSIDITSLSQLKD